MGNKATTAGPRSTGAPAQVVDLTLEGRPAVSRSSPAELESLRRDLESLGLSGYEARVLLAILQLGSAGSLELSRLSGVPRTSIYPVLESLSARSMVEMLPGEGAAKWVSHGVDEVMNRLQAEHEEQLEAGRARIRQMRDVLARALPESPPITFPFVRMLRTPRQTTRLYRRLLSEARSEVLVTNRGPYRSVAVIPEVLETVRRGVSTRALYAADELDAAESAEHRRSLEVYHAAGVDGRVLDQIPLKIAVFDRASVLLSLEDPVNPEPVAPTPMHFEHAAYAHAMADLFEHYWAQSRPYTNVHDDAGTDSGLERPGDIR